MLSLELMDLLHQWTMKRRQERKQDPPRIVILWLHHRKNGHVLPHYVQNLGRLDVQASLVRNLILHASDEVKDPLEEVLEDMDEQLGVVRTWLLQLEEASEIGYCWPYFSPLDLANFATHELGEDLAFQVGVEAYLRFVEWMLLHLLVQLQRLILSLDQAANHRLEHIVVEVERVEVVAHQVVIKPVKQGFEIYAVQL